MSHEEDRRSRFDALVMPHLEAANNYACWLCRDRSVAEEVVQEALLRALRSLEGFQGASAKPWLLSIVRNVFRTALRKRRREVLALSLDCDDERDNIERHAINRDLVRKLDRLITRLPEEFREALILREVEDLSYQELSEVTGVPIGTVMSRLHRARTLLRQDWEHGLQ